MFFLTMCGTAPVTPPAGALEVEGGVEMTDIVSYELESYRSNFSYVDQNVRLFNDTISGNIAFGQKESMSIDLIRNAAKVSNSIEFIEKLDKTFDSDIGEDGVTLSGGQRQRVAIGRSIVRAPSAFLFDEPLSNLDAALRVEMRLEIAKLHKSLRSTMIYVTHDQTEAMTLADRIVVLDDGKIIQVGTPRQLYKKPSNLFVAQFIGSPKMNIINCNRLTNSFLGNITSDKHLEVIPHKFGIRPEHIKVNSKSQSVIKGKIDVIEYLGADSFLFVDCEDLGIITVRVDGSREFNLGEMLNLEFQLSLIHI